MNTNIDYASLLAKYDGSPLKVAAALGYIKPNSSQKIKDRAGARVGMWKHNGIPKKAMEKLVTLLD